MERESFVNIEKLLKLGNSKELVSALQVWGALPQQKECKNCKKPMKIAKTVKQFRWRCEKVNKTCKTVCRYGESLLENTFFHRCHRPLVEICQFINLWVYNVELSVIKRQIGEKNWTQATAVKWSRNCRELLLEEFLAGTDTIGGIGKTVEIDESKFGKRKYNKGRKVEGQWVFGGVERESGKVIMVPVKNRTSATLIPLIKKWIRPGTTIISDCWSSYKVLGKMKEYKHMTVNHSYTFKDPITQAHTNTIEGSWRPGKQSYRSSGRRKEFYAAYLAKYMFMKKCRALNLDPFIKFLQIAGRYKDVLGQDYKIESE